MTLWAAVGRFGWGGKTGLKYGQRHPHGLQFWTEEEEEGEEEEMSQRPDFISLSLGLWREHNQLPQAPT